MFLLGIMLIIGILLWRAASRLEWSIPLKWQSIIKAWKEGLGSRTHIIKYVWYFSPKNSEMEKHFWHLQLALPRLRKEFRVPLWIKVRVHNDMAQGQKGLYISCLQRRFPGMEIQECPLDVRCCEEGEENSSS
jgi:hypothetical protein